MHTKTPWKILMNNEFAYYFGPADELYVGLCRYSDHSQRTENIALDNAKYIVHCVNNHERLVSALKYVINSTITAGIAGINGEELQIIRRKCEEALKTSEG